MLATSNSSAEIALQQLAEQFSHWRQSRRTPYGPRIPEALWTEAIRLVQVLPLTRVAKALRLRIHGERENPGLRQRVRYSTVSDLAVGPVTLRNTPVQVLDLSVVTLGLGVEPAPTTASWASICTSACGETLARVL